nr:protein naked cuticle homolog 2 [Loxodonta africana]
MANHTVMTQQGPPTLHMVHEAARSEAGSSAGILSIRGKARPGHTSPLSICPLSPHLETYTIHHVLRLADRTEILLTCLPTVVLSPEKAEGHEGSRHLCGAENGDQAACRDGALGPGRKCLHIDELQCDISLEEDNRQEWTFTLYDFNNSGKVTREDMSSLMHTIYEVVDASVNHSSGSSKTLRVKLTFSPEPPGKRKEGLAVSQGEWGGATRVPWASWLSSCPHSINPREASPGGSPHATLIPLRVSWRPGADATPCPVRGPYCVDENTERRNHYLDLAGIENYTSKFGPDMATQPPLLESSCEFMQQRSRLRPHAEGPQASDDHTCEHMPATLQ